MVKVYAVVLGVGVIALFAWIVLRGLSGNVDRPSIDPERRFGTAGRRWVAAATGFGMAGMSSEFSPRDISWPLALVLAIAGGAALAWFAGWVDAGGDLETDGSEAETG